MHEHVYVDDIVKEAQKQGKVRAITIELGELAPITPEDLKHALEVTGWAIKIFPKKGFVHCHCGFRGAPNITERGHDFVVFNCPKCKAELPRIMDGKDVVLKDVTVSE